MLPILCGWGGYYSYISFFGTLVPLGHPFFKTPHFLKQSQGSLTSKKMGCPWESCPWNIMQPEGQPAISKKCSNLLKLYIQLHRATTSYNLNSGGWVARTHSSLCPRQRRGQPRNVSTNCQCQLAQHLAHLFGTLHQIASIIKQSSSLAAE